MKFSAVVSFVTLSVSAVLAIPVSPFNQDGVERRHAQPVRRTESPATTSETTTSASETATVTSSFDSSATPTQTYFYSTITNTDGLSWSTSTQTQPESTETVSTFTSTEYPQPTEGVSNGQFSEIIHIQEVIKIKEIVVIEQPVFVAVKVNIFVRQEIFFNQFQNVFRNRFDNWDNNVVEQLALIISQQYDVLIHASNSDFGGFSNDNFNSFVSKFISHFEVFESIQLVDVQQFIVVIQQFSIEQLSSFFGRSDVLFSQSVFDQFHINNSFTVFVQELSSIIVSISSDVFDSDGIFNLNDSLLHSGLSLGSF